MFLVGPGSFTRSRIAWCLEQVGGQQQRLTTKTIQNRLYRVKKQYVRVGVKQRLNRWISGKNGGEEPGFAGCCKFDRRVLIRQLLTLAVRKQCTNRQNRVGKLNVLRKMSWIIGQTDDNGRRIRCSVERVPTVAVGQNQRLWQLVYKTDSYEHGRKTTLFEHIAQSRQNRSVPVSRGIGVPFIVPLSKSLYDRLEPP